jgi:hypothetical protein
MNKSPDKVKETERIHESCVRTSLFKPGNEEGNCVYELLEPKADCPKQTEIYVLRLDYFNSWMMWKGLLSRVLVSSKENKYYFIDF